MNYVRRKATTLKSKHTPQNFAELKETFLNDIVAVVGMEEITPELVLNWDQTGIHLVPASAWTMDKMGSKCVETTGVNNKHQITAVFVAVQPDIFYLFNLFTKVRHNVVFLVFNFLWVGLCPTHSNTGPQRRQ